MVNLVNLVNLIPPMVATMHQTLVRVVPYLILMIIISGGDHFWVGKYFLCSIFGGRDIFKEEVFDPSCAASGKTLEGAFLRALVESNLGI